MHHYIVEEDICLGEALVHFGVTLTGSRFPDLGTCMWDVHRLFVKKAKKFGIKGTRSRRSLIDRLIVLRRHFKKGLLNFHTRDGSSLEPQRYLLFSRIFVGHRNPGAVGSNTAKCTPRVQQTRSSCREHARMKDREPVARRGSLHGKIRKEKHVDAKGLLNILCCIHKQRTDVMVRREENERKQQEVVQIDRKWKRDMVKRLWRTSYSDDSVSADFLKTLDEISANDAKLDMVRENKVREQIENDRENCEWERSNFEELMKRHCN